MTTNKNPAHDGQVFDPTDFRRNFPPLANMTHLASCSQGALSAQLTYSLLDIAGSLQNSGAPWGCG